MVSLTFEGHELNEPKHAPWPLWDAGFRVFFLGAAAYSVLAVLAWALVYAAGVVVPLEGVSLFHWHAQAMVYGYALAVVAGFLLTAIERWTGEPRLRGPVLGVLAGLWAVPRGVLLFGTQWITVAAVFDGLFVLGLIAVLAGPIVRSRSWKHMGVLTKLVFLGAGQVIFYVHAIGGWADGGRVAVYGGLYMLVGLTLVISRRVLPMFIARGVGYPVELRNSLWLDGGSLVLFVVFFALELGAVFPQAAGGVALMLFAIQSVRLVFWHTPGIWRKPLLWGLYLAVVWFDVGFLLTGWSRLGLFGGLSPFVAVHAFAYGGIGMATLSMMARVSLGHTGRSIHHPPRWTGMMLGLLAMGTGVRVILPALIPSHHLTWVVMSQGLWVAAFGLFLILYGRFLVGREGGGVG